jgi:methylaspartate mutase sigma subunit
MSVHETEVMTRRAPRRTVEHTHRISNSITVVLGVIGADCHAVGNRILDHVLGGAGFKVVNLGVMVSQDEFIDAAIETNARAILVSSIYGHGEIDCAGFRARCLERGIGNILLYAGGNLVIGKREFSEVERLFSEMGFNRVFPSNVDLTAATDLIRKDIEIAQ